MSASLEIAWLARSYADKTLDPERVLEEVYERIERTSSKNVFIERVPFETAQRALKSASQNQALFGVPFAVKDNIDVLGLPTTAGCPEFGYSPARSASVVERLIGAGAILVGKTNLDQFATGLVGTRSPYGTCASAFDDRYISGGSSSGSALAVALGLVSFALGTDTAGSGRVPAAFNNVVGFKPTRGVLSTAGVVPACRSLDCVSVFAASASDAERVLGVAAHQDASDPFSRPRPLRTSFRRDFRFGVPRPEQLEFFGDRSARELFERTLERLQTLGGKAISFDFSPFRAAGELLYGGPWVAERLAALGAFIERRPNAVDPVVYRTITGARQLSAVDAFNGLYRLRELDREARKVWAEFDVMLVPTAGTIYTIDQVRAEPVTLNANLGRYTNFVNLLDLSAVAVPAGFRESGTPFGVSLIGASNTDHALLALADALHRSQSPEIGATGVPLSELGAIEPGRALDDAIELAVVGAHLSGQPLNHELVSRQARLVRTCRTSPEYRLYALSGSVPAKPGLLRERGFAGPGIEVEVWQLSVEAFGSFVAGVPPPLGIGTLLLEDGSEVHGFVCEPYALRMAREITEFGGWRAYLRAKVA